MHSPEKQSLIAIAEWRPTPKIPHAIKSHRFRTMPTSQQNYSKLIIVDPFLVAELARSLSRSIDRVPGPRGSGSITLANFISCCLVKPSFSVEPSFAANLWFRSLTYPVSRGGTLSLVPFLELLLVATALDLHCSVRPYPPRCWGFVSPLMLRYCGTFGNGMLVMTLLLLLLTLGFPCSRDFLLFAAWL